MKKIILILIVLGGVAGLSLPVANILTFKGTPFQAYADGGASAQTIRPILEKKCLSCHSPNARLPFYANFPVARQIIQADVDLGTKFIDLEAAFNPPVGMPAGETVLAKLEDVVSHGSMPPLKFVALHWDSMLNVSDKKAILNYIHSVREVHYATHLASPAHKNDALQPLPDAVKTDSAKVKLGEKLYNDKRLSGDNTLTCATCHGLDKGGTDREKFSTGIREQMGPINAPTVFNAVFNFVQFWDGRAKDLNEQAGGPVANPKEMGAKWPDVLVKLNQDAALTAEFMAIYPNGITQANVQDAIAEFEKTLITPDSRFDLYMKGDASALTAQELKGYQVFRARGCYTCHTGKSMGGQSYEKLGMHRDYFADRGNLTEADNGRYNATKNEADRHYFKVPTLRNIAQTYPYFHDGSTSDLKEAVKTMAKYQNEDPLSDEEAAEVAAFLRTLTGKYQGKYLS